ncbi:MAG: T9SS type A sorting domain-containing protein [Candidatus Kapabacteria bacterium]|nr:T9SS type A sorting domain-containing protein [Candidatus Kapabacteria bacterium]
MKKIYILFLISVLKSISLAQTWMYSPYFQPYNLADSSKIRNFYEIQKAFNLYEKDFDKRNISRLVSLDNGFETEGKFPGYAQYKRWEWHTESRVYPTGDITLPSNNYLEFQKYLNSDIYKKCVENVKKNSVQSTGNWVPLGPTGNLMGGEFFGGSARVNFLRFDPKNSQIMWTGSPTGGLWTSTDGGLNWTCANTDQLSIIGCSDLAINPVNTKIMYLATGDGNGTGSQLTLSSIGIFKSTDGGGSWGANTMNWQVSMNRNVYKIIINPINPDTVLAATSDGVYRTLNAGASWTQVQKGHFTDIEFKPTNPNVVYAVAGLFNGGSFYKSTDGGGTFYQITSGLPSGSSVGRLEIGVTPADSNYIYVVAVKPGIYDFYGFYRSTDGGDNFTFRASTPNILAGVPSSQAWYNLSMAVSPIRKDTIIVGATDTWRSLDGGLTWIKHTSNGIGGPLVHPDHHALEYLPGTDSVYFSGNDGGIWKTTNYGKTWKPRNEGQQISQMYKLGTSALNPYTIFTGHQDMATQRFKSGNWSIFTPNTGDGMECILERTNDTIVYIESYMGWIIKAYNTYPLFDVICSNSGTGVNAQGSWITPFIMHPSNDSILLVGKSQVWRTSDKGMSFKQVGNVSGGATNLIALAYAPSNPDYIYAAKSNKLFISVDGINFADKTSNLPVASSQITAIAVSNSNPGRAYITFSGYSSVNKVWGTADTGKSWTSYSTGLPNLPVNCIVYRNNTNNELYVGTDVGVYMINDTLKVWQPFFTGLPNVDVQELEIAYSINKIRAATNGRGLWESDLPGLSTLTLLVSPNNLSISAPAMSSKSFLINSNANWIISCDQSWLSANISYGNGNSTITLTALENKNTISRAALVTVTAIGAGSQQIIVTQEAGTKAIYDQNEVKRTYNLQITPNPFFEHSSISFTIEHSTSVSLLLEDIFGRELAELLSNEFVGAGTHKIDFYPDNLPDGVYFCRIKSQELTESIKIIIMK